MNSHNNPVFQFNDFNSRASTDSGLFTPQSYSSGRGTPNSQFSSSYDMSLSNIYGHSSNEDNLPIFCDKSTDYFDSKLFQQCTLNVRSPSFDSSQNNFDRGMNKVVSYIDGPFSKSNNSQYYNQQLNRDDRKYQKNNNNRNRRPFNKDNEELYRVVQGNFSYEYKK